MKRSPLTRAEGFPILGVGITIELFIPFIHGVAAYLLHLLFLWLIALGAYACGANYQEPKSEGDGKVGGNGVPPAPTEKP